MTEYPSNSHKAAATPPASTREPLAPIVTGPVITSKPSLGRRFKDAFTGQDGRTVAVTVLWDVIVPAGKDMIRDAGNEALERLLYGEARGRRTTRDIVGSNLAQRVRYDRPGWMQDPRERQQPRQQTNPTRGRISIDDITVSDRYVADAVIDRLHALIQNYGQATVADLFDLVGKTGEYTDEKFGWRSMEGARPHRVSDGYRLELPRPTQLD